MVRGLLVRLAAAIARHPMRVALLSAIPCVVLGLAALRTPVDLAFLGIMNPDDPLIARYNEINADLRLARRLPLLLEGPEERLDPTVDDLVPTLQSIPEVERVVADPPLEWLEAQAPWLVDRPVFDAWILAATDPSAGDAVERLREGLEKEEARLQEQRVEGARLLLVVMANDPLTEPVGDNGFPQIEEATLAALEGTGVTGEYAGMAALSQQDQANVLARLQVLSPLTLLAVLALLLFVERRPARLLAVAAPMLLALGGTLGLVGLLTGEIIIIEAFFGMMVFGLGVDFALHLTTRLREESSGGAPFERALGRTLAGAGTGIVAGAATTAGAFFVIAMAPDPIGLHLGLSGGIGLVLCLVLMLTLLPALWTLLDRRVPRGRPPPVAVPLLGLLARHAHRRPWIVLVAGALLVAFSVAGFGRFHFETDLERVFSRDVPALATTDRIQELFGVNSGPWITTAETLEEARELAAAFEADPTFARAESAASLLPADLEERSRILREARPTLDVRYAVFEAMAAMPGPMGLAAPPDGLRLLDTLRTADDRGPPSVDDLPLALREQLLAPDGRLLVMAYTADSTLSGEESREQRLAAQAIDPDAASFMMAVEAMLLGERPWLHWVLAGILALVATVLALDQRSLRWSLLALAPVLFGTSVTFGLLCWVGHDFNVMGALVVPLIIGLGVDDGIHVVHRMREGTVPPAEAAESVGRAIVLTTATTCIGVSGFLFADHPGLESMAIALLLGLPLCLLGSICLIPALAKLLRVA